MYAVDHVRQNLALVRFSGQDHFEAVETAFRICVPNVLAVFITVQHSRVHGKIHGPVFWYLFHVSLLLVPRAVFALPSVPLWRLRLRGLQ